MSLEGPPPVSTNPFVRIAQDVREMRRYTPLLPPGELGFSPRRTSRMLRDPLNLLLELYERHGPVFSVRVLHQPLVFVLGPQANHHLLVSNAKNFTWREGGFGELIPLLGDGLLTIDGPFHRHQRKVMLPAFHHERIAALHGVMHEETDRAMQELRPGRAVDLYRWTRELALRIAMRALFGLDPDQVRGRVDAATEFERALSFYSKDYVLQVLRGPGTPWSRMHDARRKLDAIIFGEIRRRRQRGERGQDVLSLLLDAHDEQGRGLTDKHLRDEVMTLLFAGHDTTTSTVAFLFYELARQPGLVERADWDLELALDETLRMYPPAWIGPRYAQDDFEVCGVEVPRGTGVNYSSWVSHRLPDVWDRPHEFRPERFAPGNRERIPKGAYVPFGGGSRTCIGMRFGQAEIRVIASKLLERFRLDLAPGYRLRIRQTPTIGPRDGMPMVVREAPKPARTTPAPEPAIAA
ncbi:cytochrome P450 [Conexibacter sp. SYSU D00693]|uniref:cytochrome P450 n=1 Tax=Conexibacter sp. SYSU D00693 TaxID=2812560 RepID=UPI00196A3012|nr:cytochrome P450 [Conexibacter sp. SYSU D00693]